jgi:hypothetical protein
MHTSSVDGEVVRLPREETQRRAHLRDDLRQRRFRRQPVVDIRHRETRRQHPAAELGVLILAGGLPVTAVDEHPHRRTRHALRAVQIQRLVARGAIGDIQPAAEPGARFPSQLERTNARSEALLAMAKRLNVCVVALSQITKEGSRADGKDRMPDITDLNYGGAISQAADVVILLHRAAYFAERKIEKDRTPEDWKALKSRVATAVVDKARAGQRSQVEFLMDMPTAAVWEQK